jgi:hypothetical protein
VDLGLLRHQGGQYAGQAQGVLAQAGAEPVVAGGGGVALVEDQVDDLQDRAEAGRAVRAVGHLEGDVLAGQGAFGAHDALRDRRFRDEEGAGDLGGGQAAEARIALTLRLLGGQHRVAGGEDQAQQVVVDVLRVGGLLGRRRGGGQVAADLRELAGVVLAAPDQVDGAAPGGGHEPGARIVGHAVPGPLFQGRDHRVLREFLGDADVPDQAGDAGDDARGLQAEDRLDGLGGLGGSGGLGGLWFHSPPCNSPGAYGAKLGLSPPSAPAPRRSPSSTPRAP